MQQTKNHPAGWSLYRQLAGIEAPIALRRRVSPGLLVCGFGFLNIGSFS